MSFLTCCRSVERSEACAGPVLRAQEWRWGSLWRWTYGDDRARAVLSRWPIPGGRPRQWLRTVNTPLSEKELDAVRLAAHRCQP